MQMPNLNGYARQEAEKYNFFRYLLNQKPIPLAPSALEEHQQTAYLRYNVASRLLFPAT